MNNQFPQVPGFLKDLQQIGEKNPQAAEKIFQDLAQLEEVAVGVRNQTISTNLKVKKFKGESFWQLTSGDYRIWFEFDENDEIEYLKVFKKEKNQTPKRHVKTVGKSISTKSSVKAKDVKVKEKLQQIEERKKKRRSKKSKKSKK